jgi:hypothetical protein
LILHGCRAENNRQSGVHLGANTRGVELVSLYSGFNGRSGLRLDRDVADVTLVGGALFNNGQAKHSHPEHGAGVGLTPGDMDQHSIKIIGAKIGDDQSAKTQRYALAINERGTGRVHGIHIGASSDLSGNAKFPIWRNSAKRCDLSIDPSVRGMRQRPRMHQSAITGVSQRVEIAHHVLSERYVAIDEGFRIELAGFTRGTSVNHLHLEFDKKQVFQLTTKDEAAFKIVTDCFRGEDEKLTVLSTLTAGAMVDCQSETIAHNWSSALNIGLFVQIGDSKSSLIVTSLRLERISFLPE